MAITLQQDQERKQWLLTEPCWRNRVGKDWVAKKVLGQGSEGVVGWWQYQGTKKRERRLQNVCVKQGRRLLPHKNSGVTGLAREAEFYRLFRKAHSQHVPKMYRRLYKDIGRNTMAPDQGEVERIFLEYCAGGDLGQHVEQHQVQGVPWEEGDLWEIFHCLARAAHVLRHQTLDNTSPPKPTKSGVEVCHFDLKPWNVLVGEDTRDSEHCDNPPIKITDFGFSVRVPPTGDQKAEFLERYSIWGTLDWLTPEQIQTHRTLEKTGARPWISIQKTLRDHRVKNLCPLGKQRRYGSAGNVWCIGLMMHCMMKNARAPEWKKYRLYQSKLTTRLRDGGPTVCRESDVHVEEGGSSQYTKGLRQLVLECLLVKPESRIGISALVAETGMGLAVCRKVKPRQYEDWLAGKFSTYKEPRLEDRWYSGHEVPITSHQERQVRQVEEKIKKTEAGRLAKRRQDDIDQRKRELQEKRKQEELEQKNKELNMKRRREDARNKEEKAEKERKKQDAGRKAKNEKDAEDARRDRLWKEREAKKKQQGKSSPKADDRGRITKSPKAEWRKKAGTSDLVEAIDALKLSVPVEPFYIKVIEKYDRDGKPMGWERKFKGIYTTTTVLAIKRGIEKNGRYGIRASKMRLWIGNREMQDSQTLGEFGKISETLQATPD